MCEGSVPSTGGGGHIDLGQNVSLLSSLTAFPLLEGWKPSLLLGDIGVAAQEALRSGGAGGCAVSLG